MLSKPNVTSPMKRRLPITQHRQGLSQQLEKTNAISPSATFTAKHLKSPRKTVQTKIASTIKELVRNFKTNKSEPSSYVLACRLLNEISRCISKHLKFEPNDTLVFLDHHSSSLQEHPCPGTAAKPDIVVTSRSQCRRIPEEHISQASERQHKKYSKLPWHLIDSLGEVKPRRDIAAPSQVGAYAGFLNQARPDKPGVYCISLSPRQYRILWSDPSGLYSSEDIRWDNILPLISYIFSLYTPPIHHIKIDPTISLDPGHLTDSPKWTVRFQGETYRGCRTIFVGSPWTRQSWIAISDADPDNPRIIKDQYQSQGGRYDEAQLFDKLQQDIPGGHAPGCVHVKCHGDVIDVYTPNAATRRFKKRIVMTTFGHSLYNCKSVFDFLTAMYDALEAHRWVFAKRSILHRDISIANVLLSGVTSQCKTPDIDGRPKFVNEILDPTNVCAPSRALLCDFDNGCIYSMSPSTDSLEGQPTASDALEARGDNNNDDIKRKAAELKNRTGTPIFIARSVARGQILVLPAPPLAMPKLEGTVKAAYESAHDHDPLRKYEDPENLTHGGVALEKKEILMNPETDLKDYFYHRPCHDAESVFWVIVVFLIRALPIWERANQKKASGSQRGGQKRDLEDGDEDDKDGDDADEGGNKDDEDGEEDDDDEEDDEDGEEDSEDGEEDGEDGEEDDENEEEDEEDSNEDVEDGDGDGKEDNDDEELKENNHEDSPNKQLDFIWNLLAQHAIEEGHSDIRNPILDHSQAEWRNILHPRLSFLAPMLKSLCDQVAPEYAHVIPEPEPLHLHEAMQRILLMYIWDMHGADPISLDQKLRKVTLPPRAVEVHTTQPSLGQFSKRAFPDEEQQNKKGNKRKKA